MSLEKNKNAPQELFDAAQDGDLGIVRAFIKEGCSPNSTNQHGAALIHLAAQGDHADVVKFLIESGADVNALTQDGWTALHFAARQGFVGVVKILLSAGIDFDIPGLRYNRTALHYASEVGRVEVVRELIRSGANALLKDKDGKTARDLAVANKHREVADIIGIE